MKKTEAIIKTLAAGGVGILPTDTLYGIVGSALDKKAVARIYRLRARDLHKPMIVLIGSYEELGRFGIARTRNLDRLWPGRVSVILKIGRAALKNKLKYLHRGTGTLALRMPKPKWLRELLVRTGPLVAPSTNPQGRPPAKTIRAAKKYFGKKVDFYYDIGKLDSKPSTLLKLEKGKITVLRAGAVKIKA